MNIKFFKKHHKYLDLRHFVKQGFAISEELNSQKNNILNTKEELQNRYFQQEILPGIVESKREVEEALQRVKENFDQKFSDQKKAILEKVDLIWFKFEKQFMYQLNLENFEERVELWVRKFEQIKVNKNDSSGKFQQMLKLEKNEEGLKHISLAQQILTDVLETQERLCRSFKDFKSQFHFQPNFPQNQNMINFEIPQMNFESDLINENLNQNILLQENEDLRQLNDVQNRSSSRNFLKKSSRNQSISNQNRQSYDQRFFQTYKQSRNQSDQGSFNESKNKSEDNSLHLDLVRFNESSEDQIMLHQDSEKDVKKQEFLIRPDSNNYEFKTAIQNKKNQQISKRKLSATHNRRHTTGQNTAQNTLKPFREKSKKSFLKKSNQSSRRNLPSLSPIPKTQEFQETQKKPLKKQMVPSMTLPEAIQALKAGARNINLSHQNNDIKKLAANLTEIREIGVLNISNNSFTDKSFGILCKRLNDMKVKKMDISGNLIGYVSLKRLHTSSIISGNIKKIIAKSLKMTQNQIQKIQNDFLKTTTKIFL